MTSVMGGPEEMATNTQEEEQNSVLNVICGCHVFWCRCFLEVCEILEVGAFIG